MAITSAVSLFLTLLLLALIPGASSMTVASRSAAFGFTHGVFVTLGIIAVDVIFIVIAITGLTLLADAMGEWVYLIKYIAAAYLIWLGLLLWRFSPAKQVADKAMSPSLGSSFLAGFLITLADQKAILFYFGFFPVFLDLSILSYFEMLVIISITLLALSGAKLFYAYSANRLAGILDAKLQHGLQITAAITIMAAAVWLLLSDWI